MNLAFAYQPTWEVPRIWEAFWLLLMPSFPWDDVKAMGGGYPNSPFVRIQTLKVSVYKD